MSDGSQFTPSLEDALPGILDKKADLVGGSIPRWQMPYDNRVVVPFPAGMFDHTALILESMAQAQAAGVGLHFGSGVYRTNGITISGPLAVSGCGRSTVLKVKTGATTNTPFRITSTLGNPVGTWTGAIAVNGRAFTIPATGLVAGDQVFLKLGTDPYDDSQPLVRMFNTVESVVGSVVTMRIGVPEAIPDPVGVITHRIYKPSAIAEGVIVENLALDYDDGMVCDQALEVVAARNITVRNIFGVRTAGGLLVTDSENVSVDGVYFRRGDRTIQPTAGRIFGAWGCRNLSARNIFSEDVDGTCIFLESQNRGVLLDNVVLQSGPGADYNAPHIQIAGNSTGVTVRNLRINSTVARPVINSVEESQYRTEDVYLENGCIAFYLHRHSGLLQWNGKTYWKSSKKTLKIPIPTTAGLYEYPLAEGLWTSVRAMLTTKQGILFLGCEGDAIAGMTANAVYQWPPKGVGAHSPDNHTDTDEKSISIQVDGSTPDGNFLYVEAEFLQADNSAPMMDFAP